MEPDLRRVPAVLLYSLDDSRWGTECWCHQHREHVPQESHHIWPLGWGGPDLQTNRILICSNAHSAIHRLMAIWVKTGQTPGPLVMRQYGPRVRFLARLGVLSYRTQTPPPHPVVYVPQNP